MNYHIDAMKIFMGISLFVFALCFEFSSAYAGDVMTWEDCIAEAKSNSPTLISSKENLNQQKAQKWVTASTLFPQVSANMTATKSKRNVTVTPTGAVDENYYYGVSGNQLVFDGLKSIYDVKSSSEDVNAAREEYKLTSSKVRLNLRAAFVNLMEAQEMIRVVEEIIKIRRDNFKLIELRYKSGLEHKGALLTAEANLAQAEYELSEANRALETARRQLFQAMGRSEFSPIEAKGDFSVVEDHKSRPDLERLLNKNPSILEAGAKKRSSSYDLKSSYGAFSPQVSAFAGAGRTSSDWPPSQNQWNIGVSVSLPILEGGATLANVSKSRAALRQADADERSTRDQVVVGLQEAWAGFVNSVDSVEVQRKLLDAAQTRSKIADAQYSTGFISFDNWIIIEDDLVKIKKSYLSAKADALLAEAKWIYAKGETLEYVK